MLRLSNLKVKNCRGIVNGPDIEFSKSGAIIFGDNGTGKSSYIDAIEKVLTNKCSSLDAGILGISWSLQGAHISCNENNSSPEIELGISDGNTEYVVTLNSDSAKLDEPIRKFIDSAKEFPFILRRKTVLDFINAQPRKRYDAIEGFLKLDEYNSFENAFISYTKKIENKVNSLKREKERLLRNLSYILQVPLDILTADEDISDKITPILNSHLKSANIESISIISDINSRILDIERFLNSLNENKANKTFFRILALTGSIPEPQSVTSMRNNLLKEYNILFNCETSIKGEIYLDVLEKGLKVLQQDILPYCPLCNSAINREEVIAYVQKKLEENEKFIDLNKKFKETTDTFRRELLKFLHPIEEIKLLWAEVFQDHFPESANSLIRTLEELTTRIHQQFTDESISCYLDNLTENKINLTITDLKNLLEEKKKEYPGFEKYAIFDQLKLELENVQQNAAQFELVKNDISYFENVLKNLSTTAEIIASARKNTIQKFMESIAEVANEYFEIIHPGESIGNPTLKFKSDNTTTSINLESKFHSIEKTDPRGFYSEGHTDSLALCLFLAIRRFQYDQKKNFAILILDDVLHSIDGEHRRATANLIFEKFDDHQIIITTHDRLWFENLKLITQNSKKFSSIKKYRISSWSLERGPVFGESRSDYEWLKSSDSNNANPSDKIIRAGRFLEGMLLTLCESLEIAVPLKNNGNYMLEVLWNSFYSKANKKQLLVDTAGRVLDNIEKLRKLRNWGGAHYNDWAFSITDSEADEFVKNVLELNDYLYCRVCNRYVQNMRNLNGFWLCRGKHIQY